MTLLSQTLMMLLAIKASLGQCPPREDILPCSCRLPVDFDDYFNIQVLCWKVDDVDDVRRALQSVRGIQRVSVEFRDSRLGSVPSDLFKGLHVTEVSFQDCVLNKFGDEGRSALEGLEDIVEKFSVNCFAEDNGLRFLNISSLRALEKLNIEGNNVKELGNKWFAEGPTNLKELYISINSITSLGNRVFTQLTNIHELWMAFNEIKTLTRSMFPSPAVYLNLICMNNNEISSLPSDMFSNMPAMKELLIYSNFIQRITETTWKPIWSNLIILELEDNPLICDADIEWTLKESRPKTLTGKCASPDVRKGKDLKEIIDAKHMNK